MNIALVVSFYIIYTDTPANIILHLSIRLEALLRSLGFGRT